MYCRQGVSVAGMLQLYPTITGKSSNTIGTLTEVSMCAKTTVLELVTMDFTCVANVLLTCSEVV